MYKLLDLFCCAGGCTKGYQRAGFYVAGVDIEPQPRYCGNAFVLMDAIDALEALLAGDFITDTTGGRWYLSDFAVFGASPPCEGYSKAAKQWRMVGREYPDLVAATRDALLATGKPFVIENVPGAPLINPVFINGAMFDMNIHRPRPFEIHGFEVPFFLQSPPRRPIKMGRKVRPGDVLQPVGHFSGVEYAREQMDLPWMTQEELAHAIPPAYTQWIGDRLMDLLQKNAP